MAQLLLLTQTAQSSVEILPALSLLHHHIRILPASADILIDTPQCDALVVDGRQELAQVRSFTRLLETTGTTVPIIVVVTEGGLTVVGADWGFDDVLLDSASPAEVEARLRLAIARRTLNDETGPEKLITNSGLVIDDAGYTAKIHDRLLDLTYKEFELLKFLAQHPGRVFTRQQLLHEVWGYDYFGGTRTVDVHVRRLRAKLGIEQENLIGTVRNVGYRFVTSEREETSPDQVASPQ